MYENGIKFELNLNVSLDCQSSEQVEHYPTTLVYQALPAPLGQIGAVIQGALQQAIVQNLYAGTHDRFAFMCDIREVAGTTTVHLSVKLDKHEQVRKHGGSDV